MHPPRVEEGQYERFFGLSEQPFALTTDPRFHFKSASHRAAFEELKRGLERGEGFLVLSGETGLGKTTLVRAVIDSLGGRTFSAIVTNPAVADAELLRVILRDFGVVSRTDLQRDRFQRADSQHLHETLETFLQSLVPLGARAVLVVDEAQGLNRRTLEQIRVLGNMETNGHRLMQIVLSGQPGLEATLRADDLQQLDQRISRRVRLEPLTREEVEQYIAHRLRVAGAEARVSFTGEAAEVIHRHARGVPRLVNLIADRSLDEAQKAGAMAVSADHVRRAARLVREDLSAPPPEGEGFSATGGRRARGFWRVLLWLLVLLGLAAAGAAGYYIWRLEQQTGGTPSPPSGPAITLPQTAEPRGQFIGPDSPEAQNPEPATPR